MSKFGAKRQREILVDWSSVRLFAHGKHNKIKK